jgi:hypothetical protein
MESEHPGSDKSLQSTGLPELRADHIPDDVLAEDDADTRIIEPHADPLGHQSGASDDVLAEIETSGRTTEVRSITPTDDEVLDLAPDEQ